MKDQSPLIEAFEATAKPTMTPSGDVLQLLQAVEKPEDAKKRKAEELYEASRRGDWKTLTNWFC
jgi:hypothetical protein